MITILSSHWCLPVFFWETSLLLLQAHDFKHNWLLPSLAPLVLESSCDLGLELCLSLDIAMDPRPANQRQWSLVPDLCWCGWEGSTFLPPLGLLTRGQLVATQREAEHRDKERDPVLNTTNSLIQCCLGFSDTGLLKWVWFESLGLRKLCGELLVVHIKQHSGSLKNHWLKKRQWEFPRYTMG